MAIIVSQKVTLTLHQLHCSQNVLIQHERKCAHADATRQQHVK